MSSWKLNKDYSIDIQGRTTTDSMYDLVAGPKPADVVATPVPDENLAAVRRLAYEDADTGLLSPELAAGIRRVKGAKRLGVRTGNWLSLNQAQALLNAPDITSIKGLRDRAMPGPPRPA